MNTYVIVDLEMCKAYKSMKNGKMHYKRELIQIGAVSLNENYEVTDSFVTFVSPEFGEVDRYINQLTGISVEDTKNAPTAKDALQAFADWLPENTQIVAWSNNDEKQIRNELHRKSFDIPALRETFGSWIDCQQMFGVKLRTAKKYKLSEALSIADISYDYGAHNALVDAKNTARLFAKINLEDELKLSPYFISESDLDAYLVDPFANCNTCKSCYNI